MEVSNTKIDNIYIAKLIGRLDTVNYRVAEKAIFDAIENKETVMLIDFSEILYISSSGLRILLMALKKIKSLGGTFALCCLNEKIKEVFNIAGFTQIFTIYNCKDDALKGMKQ